MWLRSVGRLRRQQRQHSPMVLYTPHPRTRTIEADRSRLKQLFENLYRNAVEHGGDDVIVSIDIYEDGFNVADTGSDIPESTHEKILEAGYSTSEERTGFGLRIAKQVTEAHE